MRPSSAATFTWSGGGANVSWTTPANWGGTAPAGAGADVLVFDGSSNTTNTNNFPAATSFAGINFAATAGSFTLGGNTIALGGDILDGATNSQSISFGLTLSATRNIDVGGGVLTISGPISGSGLGIAKTGIGTLTLTGSNTYTGATTINGGTLRLDFSAPGAPTSILASTSKLALGGGTFALVGSIAGSVQTLSGATLNPGASNISTAVTVLNLGAITRNAGSALQFNFATGGATTTTANANFAGGHQSILGGYATVGGTTWAVSAAAGGAGAISGLASGSYTPTFSAAADVDTPSVATVGAVTINSLRYNVAAPLTLTLTGPLNIATGGILITPTVASNAGTISGSSITSGNGQDLIVNNNGGTILAIASQITGNIGLTVTAPSAQVWLNNASNNYTGNTIINSGRLSVNTTTAIDSVPLNSLVIVNGNAAGGGQFYTNTSVSIANNVQISGVGRAESGGSYGAFRMKGGTMSGALTLIANARIAGANNYAISGNISGPFEAEFDFGTANSSTGETVTLSNSSNSYSGGTRVSRGTVSLGAAGAAGQYAAHLRLDDFHRHARG